MDNLKIQAQKAHEKYGDIINRERPASKKPKMSIENRAAQFAPFAALTELSSDDDLLHAGSGSELYVSFHVLIIECVAQVAYRFSKQIAYNVFKGFLLRHPLQLLQEPA